MNFPKIQQLVSFTVDFVSLSPSDIDPSADLQKTFHEALQGLNNSSSSSSHASVPDESEQADLKKIENKLQHKDSLSKKNQDLIAEIALKIWRSDSTRPEIKSITVKVRPTITILKKEDAPPSFLGEPELKPGINKIPPLGTSKSIHFQNNYSEDYYQVGQILTPDMEKEFIYVNPKRNGVEPGFEAILKSDFLPGGLYYSVANNEYKAHSEGLSYEDWIETLEARQQVISIIRNNHPHLLIKGLFFIKMDYSKPDNDGEVSIPAHRSENAIHRKGTAETPQEKNVSALMEVLANSIYRSLGYPSQEAFLIIGKYEESDDTKFLVASKCVTGPEGEKWKTFDQKELKHRHLIGNELAAENEGVYDLYAFSPKQLARAEFAQRLLGDRDGVGSTGANIGYYIAKNRKAKIVNIDPGKSLERAPRFSPEGKEDYKKTIEKKMFFVRWILLGVWKVRARVQGVTDRMRAKDLRSDASSIPHKGTIRDWFQSEYKNFSMFDDVSLYDKLDAIRNLIENKGFALETFNQYLGAFPDDDKNQIYREQVEKAKERFIERIEYFEKIVGERLKLFDSKNPDLPRARLNALESLEKLTSATTNRHGKGKNRFAYQHLRVDPENRREWHASIEGDTCQYTYKAHDWFDYIKVQHLFARFKDLGLEPEYNDKDYTVTIAIDDETLLDKNKTLNEEKVAKVKGQRLMPKDLKFTLDEKTYDLRELDQLRKLRQAIHKKKGLSKEEKNSLKAICNGGYILKSLTVKMEIRDKKQALREELKSLNESLKEVRKARKQS